MSRTDNEIFELRQRVGKLERQIAFLLKELRLEYQEESAFPVQSELLDLVRKGRKIEAIKMYRAETGVGLKEAKNYIDSLNP